MPSRTLRHALPHPFDVRRHPRLAGGVAAVAASAGLLAAAAPAAAVQGPPAYFLLQGSHGADVAKVQRALHIHANGRFGRSTTHAVRAFQKHHRLLIDGIVGPQTWDALFHITPPPAPAPSWTSPSTSSGSPAYSSSYSTPSYSTPSYSAPSYSAPTSRASTSSSGGYTIPSSIVQCESGGNYSAVNPSTGAGGAYQIMPATWRAYGGQGAPQDASPAEQGAIAAKIMATQGRSAWNC